MSLGLDPRTGSGDLYEPLKALCPVELRQLEFGDVEIIGRGPEERPVLVGYEIKKVGDFLQCVRDERFVGHQLPGLRKMYELSYLVLEGLWICGPEGELLVLKRGKDGRLAVEPPPHGNWSYLTLRKHIATLEIKTGIRIAYTADRRSTVGFLAAEHQWWHAKYESHESHVALRQKELQAENSMVEYETEFEATRKMKVVASILRFVGVKRALAAARHFKSIKAMVNAPASEWLKIEGFGKKLAEQFVSEVEKEG
jgi:ERCC4-type nuclease